MGPDIVNGSLQVGGGFFVLASIARLNKDRQVRGVSWLHVMYFTAWGYWNLFYYPHLDQWVSFAGGLLLVAANTAWLVQLVYWSWFEDQRDHLQALQFGEDVGVPSRLPRVRRGHWADDDELTALADQRRECQRQIGIERRQRIRAFGDRFLGMLFPWKSL